MNVSTAQIALTMDLKIVTVRFLTISEPSSLLPIGSCEVKVLALDHVILMKRSICRQLRRLFLLLNEMQVKVLKLSKLRKYSKLR